MEQTVGFATPYDKQLDLPVLRINREYQKEIMQEDWLGGWFGHLKTGKDLIAFFNSDAGKEVHWTITAGELLYNCSLRALQKNDFVIEQVLDILGRLRLLPKERQEINERHVFSFMALASELHAATDGFYTLKQQWSVLDALINCDAAPKAAIESSLNQMMIKAIRAGDRERVEYLAVKGVRLRQDQRKKTIFNLFKGIMRKGKITDFEWGRQMLNVMQINLESPEDVELINAVLSTSIYMAPPNSKTKISVSRIRSLNDASIIVQFLRSNGILLTNFSIAEKIMKWAVRTMDISEKYLLEKPEVVEMVKDLTIFLVGSGAPISDIPVSLEIEKDSGLRDLHMVLTYSDKNQIANLRPAKCRFSSDIMLLIFRIAYGPKVVS